MINDVFAGHDCYRITPGILPTIGQMTDALTAPPGVVSSMWLSLSFYLCQGTGPIKINLT